MNDRKDNISQYVINDCRCISNCGMYETFLIGVVPNFKAESKFLTYVQKHILGANLWISFLGADIQHPKTASIS